jgi:hypothetical protein
MEGSSHDPIEIYYPGMWLEGLKKTAEKLTQDSQCPC